MATNSGACSSETAGTATVIVFSGVSAENVGPDSDNKKAIKEIRMAQRFMVRSFFPVGYDPITPSRRKCPARF